MESVNSSNIAAIGYNSDNAVLTIQFIKGGVYEYYDVPSHEHDALMAAESIGSHANKNIYKTYRQQKIG